MLEQISQYTIPITVICGLLEIDFDASICTNTTERIISKNENTEKINVDEPIFLLYNTWRRARLICYIDCYRYIDCYQGKELNFLMCVCVCVCG